MTEPDAIRPLVRPEDLRVGDRVLFARASDPQHAADDPLYEPPVPAGTTAIVVKVTPDYVRVRLDDPRLATEPVRLWRDGFLPDAATNTLSSLRKL